MPGFKDLDLELCNYCGTCAGICPLNSIALGKEKVYLEGKCNECGLCYQNCPGMEVNFSELSEHFLKETKNESFEIGHYNEIFVAHSTNEKIRKKAASGGVVTSLLLYALESKLIDGAIVVGMDEKKPWKYEIKIAKTREEIIKAAQSKYSMVPLNSILRKLENEEGNFALVGLPCHIQGIRKLQMNHFPESRKIKFLIGLFCGFNLHFSATLYLIKKLGIQKDQIESLEYRGGDFPGGFRVKLKNNQEKFIGKFAYNFLIPLFTPNRCLSCVDLTNELADLSVGDFWAKNLKGGCSTVIIRNASGENLFRDAIDSGFLKSQEISQEDILHSHAHLIKYKKKGGIIRTRLEGKKPRYTLTKKPKITFFDYLSNFLFFLSLKFSQNKYIRKIICSLPLSFLKFLGKISRKL